MKKKGFTLVELLAVIVILAILMTIGISAVTNSRKAIETSISSSEKNNLAEAGKLLALDLNDYTSDIYNCKDGTFASGTNGDVACTKIDNKWTKLQIKVKILKVNKYFEDKNNHINEDSVLVIEKDNGNIKVSLCLQTESAEVMRASACEDGEQLTT